MANCRAPANFAYSTGAEIGSKHKVYFAGCGDRPREKNIAICCLQGVGLPDSALPCNTRYVRAMDTAKAGNICVI